MNVFILGEALVAFIYVLCTKKFAVQSPQFFFYKVYQFVIVKCKDELLHIQETIHIKNSYREIVSFKTSDTYK
jgi:hypothetical protein